MNEKIIFPFVTKVKEILQRIH